MAINNKLIRRLRSEVIANPKKAAVLALLVVVGVVFWAPLIAKWTGNKSSDDVPATVSSGTENTGPVAANLAAASGGSNSVEAMAKKAAPHWNHILAAIRNDPRMQPHVREEGQRDPFSPPASQVVVQAPQAPAPAPELTPEEAGIVLRSTIVGSRMKTALINGRAYHQGQSVLAGNGRDRFVVVEIRETGVVLSRHGQSYEVKLPTVDVADGNN